MSGLLKLLAWAAMAFAIGGPLAANAQSQAAEREHVVVQVSDDNVKTWNQALNVVKNLQQAYNGNIDVELVAFGNGIGILKMDSEVGNRIEETMGSGTKVLACENTMRGRKLTSGDMLARIGYVPSGVVEIVKKQKAGWAIVRP
jgi:intracellular sulfur oxidation DsrE/DsrF family protein